MSILDQIRQLEEQKTKLLEQARKEAVTKAEVAIAELNALGFNYRLTGGPSDSTPSKRRSGVRQDVLSMIEGSAQGLSRSDIIERMDVKGDKKAEQAISNALAALKKQNTINNTDGVYTAASTNTNGL